MGRRVFYVACASACALFPDVSGIGTDGGPKDVSAPDGDAGSSAPDGDAGFCASQEAGYRICTDFDESSNVSQGYASVSQNGVGGTVSLDMTRFVSPPGSALGVAMPFAAKQTSGVRMVQALWQLGTTPASIHCALQWNPVALSTTQNDYAHVIEVSLFSDAAATMPLVTYSLNMQGDGTLIMLEYFAPTSTSASHPVASTIATGWTSVSLSLDTNAQTYNVKVGSMSGSGGLSKPLPATSFAELEVGPAYFGGNTTAPSPGWTFGYDNVVCY